MKRTLSQAISGAIIFSIVGGIWAAYGAYALQGQRAGLLMGGSFALAAALIVVIIRLQKRVARLPDETLTPEMQRRDERATSAFRKVNIAQGLAIFLAVQVFFNLHKPEYLAPAIGVIVGLHFMALAGPLEMPSHWTVGGLLCASSVVTILAVADHAAWGVVVGFGNAVILWGSGLLRIRLVLSAIVPSRLE
jgi:hypothetical protein